MGRLIYSGIQSLDGYVADRDGRFDWSEPDEEVHTFINGLESSVGTYLLGRRLYEVMLAWEDPSAFAGAPAYILDFAELWKAADKVVYSRSLDFDAGTVRQLKADAGQDLAVGGAELAVAAIRAGLVDEYQLFVSPVAVGGGKRYLPEDVRLELELLEERRFGNGVVFLRYGSRA